MSSSRFRSGRNNSRYTPDDEEDELEEKLARKHLSLQRKQSRKRKQQEHEKPLQEGDS